LTGLGLMVALASCGDAGAGRYVGDYITQTDFDNLAGWGADVNALTREHAHSGRFATVVNTTREYSLTYRLPLREASVHALRAVEIDAWVFLPSSKASASLNVQVQPVSGVSGDALYNEELHLLDQVQEFGKWTPIHRVFVLPTRLPAEAELRIFLWRASSPEPVYLDDLRVKARE